MSTDNGQLLSIVVPVYNEIDNLHSVYHNIVRTLMRVQDRYEYEIIFTDNHSTDGTFEALSMLADHDRRVRVIRFSRNFGYQRSIYTGYIHARGAAAVQLDGDNQDPTDLILEFIRLWEAGFLVVYGVRRSRQETWLVTQLRRAFYWLIDAISDDDIPRDAGDFRLVDRRVLEELRKIDDHNPYLRGAIAAMGFKQIGVAYDRAPRTGGKSKFPFGRMVNLAVDGIVNHSLVPLRFATYTGIVVSMVTLLASVGYFVARLFFDAAWPRGFASTTILILLAISLNGLFLGIIGEYLGRIYRQVRRAPLTIIEAHLNSPESEPTSLEVAR